jgi:hypothetical protein
MDRREVEDPSWLRRQQSIANFFPNVHNRGCDAEMIERGWSEIGDVDLLKPPR